MRSSSSSSAIPFQLDCLTLSYHGSSAYYSYDQMTATLSFREALNEGIVSGTLVDTKIILFSRKDSSGRVYGPKAHFLRTLRSQGAEYRQRYIVGQTTADAAPPCSPKSIYILAKLVSLLQSIKLFTHDGVTLNLWCLKLTIPLLRELSFKDIEKRLSESTIVEEFFSRISAWWSPELV